MAIERQNELLAFYEKAELELKALEDLGFETDEAKEKLDNIEYQIVKEVNKMDYWLMSVKQRVTALDAFKVKLKDAISEIDKKIKANERTIDFLEDTVLPKLVNSKGKLDTGFKKYTIYEAEAELVVEDESKVPSEYIKTNITQTIDKVNLKKYVKENNPDWAYIKKVKRVKVS